MKLLPASFILGTVLLLPYGLMPSPGSAESEPPDTAQEESEPQPITPGEVHGWEVEMAEINFKTKPSIENRAALVDAYEKLGNTTCLADLPSKLSYDGSPEDPECQKILGALLEGQLENPAALCIRDGIDAKSCVEAYLDQKVEVFDERDRNSDGLFADSTKTSEAVQASKMLQAAVNTFNSSARGYDDRSTFRRAAYAGLARLCLPTSLKFDVPGEKRATPDTVASRSDYKSGIAGSLVGEDTSAVQKPTRIRRIPSACASAAAVVEKLDPSGSAGVCFREGLYTPSCIQARRVELKELRAERDRAKASAAPPGAAQKNPEAKKGFATF